MGNPLKTEFGKRRIHRHLLGPLLGLLLSVVPSLTWAKPAPIVAVLELESKEVAPDTLMLWTDLMRAALIEQVGTAVRVLTPGNQNVLLGGIEPSVTEDCQAASCDVELLRQLGASYGLVGSLAQRSNGSVAGTLTLYATGSGKALGAAKIVSPSRDEVLGILQSETERLADKIPEVKAAQANAKTEASLAKSWQDVAGKPLQVLSQLVPASTLVEDKLGMMQAQLSILQDEAVATQSSWQPRRISSFPNENVAESVSLEACLDLVCATELAAANQVPLLLRTEVAWLDKSLVLSSVVVDVGSNRDLAQASVRMKPQEFAARGFVPLMQKLVATGENEASEELRIYAQGESLSDAPLPKAMQQLGNVVVRLPESTEKGLSDAAKSLFAERLAGVLAKAEGTTVVTDTELRSMLDQEAQAQLLGADGTTVLEKVSERMNADYLILSRIQRLGDRFEISGTLTTQSEAATVQRVSFPLPSIEQLPEAAEVLARRLFGLPAVLPPPPIKASRFEDGMESLARKVSDAFAPLQGKGGMLAILPFETSDPFVKRQDAAAAATRALGARLSKGWGLAIANPQKVTDLAAKGFFGQKTPAEVGASVGARAVLVGQVQRVGSDLLVEARLIEVATGKEANHLFVFIPVGEAGSLIPEEALVLRTRSEALFRSVIPGWGQFYNGPSHAWKGGLVLAGTSLSVIGAAAMAGFGTYLQQVEAVRWYRGNENWQSSAQCGVDGDKFCQEKADELTGQGNQLYAGAGGALGIALVVYALGFVDAGLSAVDYSELME